MKTIHTELLDLELTWYSPNETTVEFDFENTISESTL